MFRCKITTDVKYYNCDFYQSTISELFDEQLEFERLSIELKGSKDEHLLWDQISSNFGRIEDLRIFSAVNPDFTPVFTSWPQEINIRSSYWFTLEYLLECTCTKIKLEHSHLGNKDLDVILNKWKTGGFPTLKCLTIYSQNIKIFGTTILGMNLRELDGMVIRTYDGSKKATIRNDFDSIEICVNLLE
ncbi:hypothetical protein CRE_30555 [Caenorhabditis remanei]|uniref:Sdz-33 F-box domain-containing protein n=1 Tax=Caenorhabditis remanei TaxID=31234 RepID=E3NMR2_CAERE|nr:hypothetical protein CRE_30555 [Caenorhabditis remanei]